MQEKKLLRDALKEIIERSYGLPCDAMPEAFTIRARQIATKALASTTDETEMEKLVAWLVETQDEALHDSHWPEQYDTGFLNALAVVKEYITTQFGEEEGDADREGDR